MAGRNHALLSDQQAIAAKAGVRAGSCIFISHFHSDKNIVRAIAKYIMEHVTLALNFIPL